MMKSKSRNILVVLFACLVIMFLIGSSLLGCSGNGKEDVTILLIDNYGTQYELNKDSNIQSTTIKFDEHKEYTFKIKMRFPNGEIKGYFSDDLNPNLRIKYKDSNGNFKNVHSLHEPGKYEVIAEIYNGHLYCNPLSVVLNVEIVA